MEWINRLNEAVEYIDEHLKDEISTEHLAAIACCSTYHFQRMFSYVAQMPLSEYIRRRKMSMAALDILNGKKVLDTALEYGYNSPTSFNRAFRSVHGCAPSEVKQGNPSLRSFPKIKFKITIKGAEEMNFRIETKEAFKVIGVSMPISHVMEENHRIIPQMWGQAWENGTIERLAGLIDKAPRGLLGICNCNMPESWKYYIAVANDTVIEDLESLEIPSATWAIFSGEGSGVSIQQLEERIFTEWLPSSGYEYADVPDIEVYLDTDMANTRYEVWIGVKRK